MKTYPSTNQLHTTNQKLRIGILATVKSIKRGVAFSPAQPSQPQARPDAFAMRSGATVLVRSATLSARAHHPQTPTCDLRFATDAMLNCRSPQSCTTASACGLRAQRCSFSSITHTATTAGLLTHSRETKKPTQRKYVVRSRVRARPRTSRTYWPRQPPLHALSPHIAPCESCAGHVFVPAAVRQLQLFQPRVGLRSTCGEHFVPSGLSGGRPRLPFPWVSSPASRPMLSSSLRGSPRSQRQLASSRPLVFSHPAASPPGRVAPCGSFRTLSSPSLAVHSRRHSPCTRVRLTINLQASRRRTCGSVWIDLRKQCTRCHGFHHAPRNIRGLLAIVFPLTSEPDDHQDLSLPCGISRTPYPIPCASSSTDQYAREDCPSPRTCHCHFPSAADHVDEGQQEKKG